MANIIFMRQDASVLEISPPWSGQLCHFKNLASFCGVSYTSVVQEGDHSDVDIPGILSVVETLFVQVSGSMSK